MKRFSCDQARDYLDSAKAELDLFRDRVNTFARTGSAEDAGHCELRKQFLQEAVDTMMEGMRICKLERAKEILGEEFVFEFSHAIPNQYVPFSESQLKFFQDENETDQRRKTVLVEFMNVDAGGVWNNAHYNPTKLEEAKQRNGAKVYFPRFKKGWRMIQTDVFPQSAGAAGDGVELYTHQIEIMRRYEKEKKLPEHSVRHATPDEVMYLLYAKRYQKEKKPLLNQRDYNLLTDIQGDDGGVVVMTVKDSVNRSDLALDYIPRNSRFSRVGCLAVIEPDHEAKPPKKMLDVTGF